MTPLRRLLNNLRALVRGRRRDDAELSDELRAYLDAAIAAKIAAGMTRADAERAARVELGSAAAIRDRVSDVEWRTRVENVWADVRYAARGLRLSPGFTAAVVLTLALGIGANVGMFTLLDVVLLRPLSLPNVDELVVLYEHGPDGEPDAVGGTGRYLRFSYPRYQRLQHALGTLGSLAAMSATFDASGRFEGTTDDRDVSAQLVSGNYFATLGALPLRGRLLTPQDDRPDVAPAVVISASLWRRALGAKETVLGQPFVVNGHVTATIVGITPEGFTGGWADQRPEVWLPARLQSDVGFRNESSSYTKVDTAEPWMTQEIYWLRVIGRIPADRRGSAEAVLRTANAQGLAILSSNSAITGRTLIVESFARGFSGLRAQYSSLILALMLLVGLLLLLTCANVAGLLLVRAGRRAREMTILAALGATAGRIARRCLVESALIAITGGIAGYLVGTWIKTTLAMQIKGTARTIPAGFSVDWRVMTFAIVASLTTAVVFGLAPVIHALRLGRKPHLSQRNADSSAGLRGLRPIVVLQLALSVVVVFAAALLGRTVLNLSRVDLGFSADHLVGAYFSTAAAGYTPEEAPAVRDRLIATATSIPGVTSAAVSMCGLFANCSYSASAHFEGRADDVPDSQLNWVGPGYFSTIGRPIVQGREFSRRDATGPRVAIVTASLVDRYFDGHNPVGRMVGGQVPDAVIVGVVSDARSRSVRDAPVPMVYYLVDQPPPARFRVAPGTIEIRVAGDPTPMVPVIRNALSRAEPHVNLRVESMPERVSQQFERERAVTALAAAFAALALLLASIGLYGVLADGVGRRTREIGVRMALGAGRTQVVGLIVRQGAMLTTIGVFTGLVAAPWLTRYLKSMLFDVSPFDPQIFLAVALVLAIIATLAAYLPARRATRVDPVIALRAE
ncbi:MAG TPA: ABC transporter permease [Vicinamibacterales bacterium]|nr:ABC transporter permease [Vicinamibacterales bacterium]